MRKKIFLLLGTLSVFGTVNAHRCACGSMASGSTTEYTISDTGGEPDCCRGIAVGIETSYTYTWRDMGDGTYVVTHTHTYVHASEAQAKCCNPAT